MANIKRKEVFKIKKVKIILSLVLIISVLVALAYFCITNNNKNTANVNNVEQNNIVSNSITNNTSITNNVNINNVVISTPSNTQNSSTPVGKHGKLSVNGIKIVDKNGSTFSLKGVSTHGIAWFPQYINKEAFQTMRDSWGINVVRLAMYSDPNAGYSTSIHEKVKEGVKYASDLGLYVIIDWHILSDGNPNIYKTEAISFFREMTNLYKDYDNIIYEICNEPNGNVTWTNDIKPYAEEVIKEIRNVDKDAIILCGTPTWSQDVDVVADNPIEGYSNIMYTLHFYADTHRDNIRNKAQTALNKNLPIFVSEFGICDASGNGNINEEEANIWIDFLNKNNISWICWNLSNKNESSALLTPDNSKISGWTIDDLSQEGKWLLEALKK